jgi:hypothetical protein
MGYCMADAFALFVAQKCDSLKQRMIHLDTVGYARIAFLASR